MGDDQCAEACQGFLQARKPAPAFDLDIEGLTEADCRDILVELLA